MEGRIRGAGREIYGRLAVQRGLLVAGFAGQTSLALGTVLIEVNQRSVAPLTWQTGGILGIGKRWGMMLEIGLAKAGKRPSSGAAAA